MTNNDLDEFTILLFKSIYIQMVLSGCGLSNRQVHFRVGCPIFFFQIRFLSVATYLYNYKIKKKENSYNIKF